MQRANKRKKHEIQPAREKTEKVGRGPFLTVGIGASAGGLEAVSQLIEALPDTINMALVVIQHLDPTYKSMLSELLSRKTRISVREVTDGMKLEPNKIYVIPPTFMMSLGGDVFELTRRIEAERRYFPIDYFLISLARMNANRAVGVLLSGTGSDGTEGLKMIKAEAGITFAQDRDSAKYPDLPQHAVTAGVVDFVLPPNEIAKELVRISMHIPEIMGPERASAAVAEPDVFKKICDLLQSAKGADFTYYKKSTIERRLNRRMIVTNKATLADYWDYLESNPPEVEALFQDILIHVTGFFREPEAFKVLKENILPRILKASTPETAIKIWVPGCSTGEEAYSIAICAIEALDERRNPPRVQIFATDINDTVIEKAREGIYPQSMIADVAPDRVKRFFTRTNSNYQISHGVRELCIFAKHDLTKDPPFSSIDVISCRNVLIYLEPILQKRALATLHYALKPSGFLLLGSSETIGDSNLFKLEDSKRKIYVKKEVPARELASLVALVREPPPILTRAEPQRSEPKINESDLKRIIERTLLARYAPVGLVVNEDMDIVEFVGDTAQYLSPLPGVANLAITKMVREELAVDIRALIQRAKKINSTVRRTGVRFDLDGRPKTINIEVVPVKINESRTPKRFYAILFEDETTTVRSISQVAIDAHLKKGKGKGRISGRKQELSQLQDRLRETREYVHFVIEEKEAANEELKAANEEILSSNEELQSINEELQSAKEELQSTNEELATLNEELANRNTELTVLNNDLNNLFSSMDIPIVILSGSMRIRRYTPAAEKLLGLTPSSTGQYANEVKAHSAEDELWTKIIAIASSLEKKEELVRDSKDHWFLVRAFPYRTEENKIEGAVVLLLDFTGRRQMEEKLKESEVRLNALTERNIVGILTANPDKIIDANDTFLNTVGYSRQDLERDRIPWREMTPKEYAALDQKATDELFDKGGCKPFEKEYFRKDGTRVPILIGSGLIRQSPPEWVCFVLDLSERRKLEELRERFLAAVTHELRTPLVSIKAYTDYMVQGKMGDLPERAESGLKIVKEQTDRLLSLSAQLLDNARLAAGRFELNMTPLDLNEIIETSVRQVNPMFEMKKQNLEIQNSTPTRKILGDRERLAQVLTNLLTNASKFSPEKSKIVVKTEITGKTLRICVSDEGIGIGKEDLPRVFEPFAAIKKPSYVKGSGLGLSISKGIVEAHGGSIRAESAGPGLGSTFIMEFEIPRAITDENR